MIDTVMKSKEFDLMRGLLDAEKKQHASRYGLAVPGKVVQFGEAGPGSLEGHDFSNELEVSTVTASVRKGKTTHTSRQTVAGAKSEYSVGVSTLGFEEDNEEKMRSLWMWIYQLQGGC